MLGVKIKSAQRGRGRAESVGAEFREKNGGMDGGMWLGEREPLMQIRASIYYRKLAIVENEVQLKIGRIRPSSFKRVASGRGRERWHPSTSFQGIVSFILFCEFILEQQRWLNRRVSPPLWSFINQSTFSTVPWFVYKMAYTSPLPGWKSG